MLMYHLAAKILGPTLAKAESAGASGGKPWDISVYPGVRFTVYRAVVTIEQLPGNRHLGEVSGHTLNLNTPPQTNLNPKPEALKTYALKP